MSNHSLLNIQEISSRTFNQQPSIMQTSIEHFGRESMGHGAKGGKKYPSYEEIIKMQQEQIDRYKNALTAYINRIQDMQKGKDYNSSYDVQIKELMVMLRERENQIEDLKERYKNAIMGLQETVEKNELLYREVEKYKKKHHEIELNYSKDQNLFNKSQNLISNLSITKSNYEIQLVNMKDSLVILEKEKKKIAQTNDEYEEKLALLSQEIERLRGVSQILKKDNEKLKLVTKEQQDFIQKIQYENHQNKQTIERLRVESRDLKTNNSNITLQLHQYHQKIMYKETIINDLQERQNRISQTLKLKDSQIKELEGRVERFSKEIQRYQEELNRRNSEHFQELGKVRISLNQKSNSQKKIEIEKEQIIREYNQLILRFQSIRREHDAILAQKEAANIQLQELSYQKAELIRQIELRVGEREKMMRENQNLKQSLIKSQTNFKLNSDDRAKHYEATIRLFQEKERNLAKEFQIKFESFNQQKNKENIAKINEINKLKAEISAKDSEISQFRSEIASKTTEIAQLKQSTMSQSTFIDNTKRDYEQRIRERTDIINQLKIKLQNCQKLIEQNRRERDLILQQKNTIIAQLQTNQQHTENKTNELKNCYQRLQTTNLQLRQTQKQLEVSSNDVNNYKRVLDENEAALKQYSIQLKDGQSRIIALTNQLQRIASLLKEKEMIILQLNTQNRQISHVFQQKKGQLVSLREINQKLTTSIARNQQSKGNFQMFMKQIQRLNQLVSSKQSQIKHQRLQIAKILQKIDTLYQQQLKIIKLIQSTFGDDARRNGQLGVQLEELKDFIFRLNQSTSGTLQDISKQSGLILNFVNHNESQGKNVHLRLNDQLSKAKTLLSQKDHQIQALKHQIMDLNITVKLKQEQQTKQQEIFQKLIELTQQNAAIKDQLDFGKSQFQMELQSKNQSIIQLQSKVHQFDKKQKKEIEQLKAYINQKQLSHTQATQSLKAEKQALLSRLTEQQQRLLQRQRQIQLLKTQKTKIQKNFDNLMGTINPRISQLEKTNEILAINTKEIERYKQLVRNFQAKYSQNQQKLQQNSRILVLQKQVQKLQKILDIRNSQITNNQEAYFKLKTKLVQLQKEYQKQRVLNKQLKANIQALKSQIRHLQQAKYSSERGLQSVSQLKFRNNQLQRQLKNLQSKLSQSQHKLQHANQQINSLKIELSKILEMNSKSIHTIALFQQKQAEKPQLLDRIHNLQDQLQATQGKFRSMQIEYDFMRSTQQQTKIHLHAYQYKTGQLEKEYLKLKHILGNMNNENSKLLTKNHFFEVQLKKAEILQQKIQVLNGEINRLSSQNINLSEEVTSCKLAMSGQYSLQKKSQQQLALIILLFAEIEALRRRVSQNQQQSQHSHNNHLFRYRG